MLGHLQRHGAIWTVALATLVLYLLMMVWTLPHLCDYAGGLLPFDLRPFGYTDPEARQLMAALGPEGRDFYLNVQHWLDTLFPLLNGLLVFWLTATAFPATPRWRFGLLGLAVTGFDLAENALVRRLLLEGVEVERSLISLASMATIAKSAACTIAYCLVLWALMRLWRGVDDDS